MKKLLTAVLALSAVVLVSYAATTAYFSDIETSEDNTLIAGALDLKIDSQAHYAGMVCVITPNGTVWQDENNRLGDNPRPELIGEPCVGTWELKDLEAGDTFIRLTDIKPGDVGENTISWHVYDNDAWGRIRIHNILDNDVSCTEPEIDSSDPECSLEPAPGLLYNDAGELSENLEFRVWLDWGDTPGFQNQEGSDQEPDPGEGDNQLSQGEPRFSAELVSEGDEIIVLIQPALQSTWQDYCDDKGLSPDGHNDYGLCHGIAHDGRLVGSATYYIGVEWSLPEETGNEVQTDSLNADISFEVEQHRNNLLPFQVAP